MKDGFSEGLENVRRRRWSKQEWQDQWFWKKNCTRHFGGKALLLDTFVSVVDCWQIFSKDRHCVEVRSRVKDTKYIACMTHTHSKGIPMNIDDLDERKRRKRRDWLKIIYWLHSPCGIDAGEISPNRKRPISGNVTKKAALTKNSRVSSSLTQKKLTFPD